MPPALFLCVLPTCVIFRYYQRCADEDEGFDDAGELKPGWVMCGDRPYRAEERPADDAVVDQLDDDVMPTSWPRMWNNTAMKKRMYRLLAKLLIGIVLKGTKSNANTQYIIHDMDGDVWTNYDFPGGAESQMPPIR